MREDKLSRLRDSKAVGAEFWEDQFTPLPRRLVILTMAGIMLALFLASLDQTIVATAMPRIIADLEGFDRFTWVTTSYLLASTTVVPIAGKLTDMYGRKWFYIAGIAVFLAGSVLAGLIQTMTMLIVFRGVQGLGGGVMMAIAFITIADLFRPRTGASIREYWALCSRSRRS